MDRTDVTTLIPFFSDLVGKLGALDVWIARYDANEVVNYAREVVGTILPRIPLRDPEFPFEFLLDAWSDSEDEPTHTQTVREFVDEVVERMQMKPEPDLPADPPAEDGDN